MSLPASQAACPGLRCGCPPAAPPFYWSKPLASGWGDRAGCRGPTGYCGGRRMLNRPDSSAQEVCPVRGKAFFPCRAQSVVVLAGLLSASSLPNCASVLRGHNSSAPRCGSTTSQTEKLFNASPRRQHSLSVRSNLAAPSWLLLRGRFSASPATGLIGLRENGFLGDFFDALGFLSLASER